MSNSALGLECLDGYFLKWSKQYMRSIRILYKNVDATGTLGLSSIQKYIAAIRMIGYGLPFDATDEYTSGKKYCHEEYEEVCEGYSWGL